MITITPIEHQHIPSFHACLQEIASERRYIRLINAPPLEAVEDFVRSNIRNGVPQFVALDNDRVVGWCDIVPLRYHGMAHTGQLGMGVDRSHRRQGAGSRLLAATLDRAFEIDLKRIELEVFASNTAAIGLYEKYGFEREGVKRRARHLDGRWDDIVIMALLHEGP